MAPILEAVFDGFDSNSLLEQLMELDWWTIGSFASIPIVASLIGYGTNIVAIQMTFLPLEYIGFWEAGFRQCGFSFGWQGIIPANAEKIARKMVVLMTTQLISVDEVFSRLDAQQIVSITQPAMQKALERVLDEVARTHSPDVWTALSLSARAELAEKATELSAPYIVAMVAEFRENIGELLDLEGLAVEKLLEDKSLMNEIFKRCGEEEFRFIERSGFYFGFLLGLLQALVWWVLLQWKATAPDLPLAWFLPCAGAVAGYVTNALAMWIIFNPLQETEVCGLRFLGLFLQRQNEVSEEFARISSARILTAQYCWENILYGEHGRARFEAIVLAQAERAVEEQVDLIRPLLPLVVGSDTFNALKQQTATLLLRELPGCLRATYDYSEEAMGIEPLLTTRMQALSTDKFERLLHPAFEEDEWKLIAVGGLLGMMVGFFQLFFVFSDVVG